MSGTDEDYNENTKQVITPLSSAEEKLNNNTVAAAGVAVGAVANDVISSIENIDLFINKSLSKRGRNWIEFAFEVLAHVEGYTIPQYGDKGDDQITEWSSEDCLKAVKKRIARYGRNAREGQQELDFKKMAHEVQLAAEKYQENHPF